MSDKSLIINRKYEEENRNKIINSEIKTILMEK